MPEFPRVRFECRQDVYHRYNELVDGMHAEMVWAHKGVKSWYQNRTDASPASRLGGWSTTGS